MKYRKGFPRGNIGSSRYSVDEDIKGGEGLFLMLPDRISGLTVVGHFWKGNDETPGTGRFKIEVTNNCPERVGSDGTGGFWDYPAEGLGEFDKDDGITIINQITGVRITCFEADDHLNVCVTG
ncbi:hypothetical protein HMPREF1222_01975 [Treponema vincentii F0403]|uniref:Uncharacterized protein n=1 Tax=Treponema vincentii F0403 TaxID=1125702 RepID=S3L7N2_9SPIR|nr:hypothetical protein [Treponema vincentii]EPF46453.1 hypothetical protein HMPREF1222_01975 [Treponema vincentii F0403]